MNAKSIPLIALSGTFIFAAGAIFAPGAAMAQAPSGPIGPPLPGSHPEIPTRAPQPPPKPKIEPRTNIAGAWKFNKDDSDDPDQRVRVAQGSSRNTNNYPGGGYPGGPGYPGGYPGNGPVWGGGSPYPGGGGQRGQRNRDQDIADNPKMQPLIHPPSVVSVSLKNPEVDINEDEYRLLSIYTDGRQLPKQTDDNHPQIAAHWNGNQLVSDEKSPLGGKMTRTYELSSDGRQLFESLRIENGKKTPLTIRYVYDATNSANVDPGEGDPDRPVLKRNSQSGEEQTGNTDPGDADPNRPVLKRNSQSSGDSDDAQSNDGQSGGTQTSSAQPGSTQSSSAQTSEPDPGDSDPNRPVLKRNPNQFSE